MARRKRVLDDGIGGMPTNPISRASGIGVGHTLPLGSQSPTQTTRDIPPILFSLVEKFDLHRDHYIKGGLNETQVRREFVDPLFEALGWDIQNINMYDAAYQDVIHEDAIKIDGERKAPDYCFRIGGTRKFFLETKKPSVKLKEDKRSAYQLRRYGWSAKLPISVLTDFEEFAVYDCRARPDQNDAAHKHRIEYWTYKDYIANWSKISSLFAKQSIMRGTLDRFAESARQKKGASAVDGAFLAEIESWREMLANNLVLRNSTLVDIQEINHAVQVTIDRIIFLRICEDRGIEPYRQLLGLTKSPEIYQRLMTLFEKADDRYNSGLFHFQNERGRQGRADSLTPRLKLDNLPLQNIITNLYYPDSPYEFSVISADLLGHVYERFLGKIIQVSSARAVTIEKRPELRKAEGVYYTPTCIVDYIVKQTVGKALKGKTTKQADRIRILDPACGSGSFLLGTYDYLLNWYLEKYSSDKSGKHPEIHQRAGAGWHLTTAEKRRILLNSIYGVDLDPQAVEVTKLSLLLKVLEGESAETLQNQRRLFHERALPDLDNNIKCGNSLVGPDFYDRGMSEGLSDKELRRINVFDWGKRFPWIEEQGGFDVVLGNPPYLNIDDTWGKDNIQQKYIKNVFSKIYNDKTDIVFYFLAKAVELSRGEVSFIVSRAFLEAFKADRLRAWLADQTDVCEVVDFRNHLVFEGVGITTAIVTLTISDKVPHATFRRLIGPLGRIDDLASLTENPEVFHSFPVAQEAFGSNPWLFASGDIDSLLKKIDAVSEPLAHFVKIGQGMQTGCNHVFGRLEETQIRKWKVGTREKFARVRNSDIQRYGIQESGECILYLEDVESFDKLPSGVRQHLTSHETDLKGRAAFQRGNCQWWRYTWPLHKEHLRRRKLFCPYLATSNRFALDEGNRFLGLTDTTVVFDSDQPEDLRYIMGLMNSKLLTLRFRYIGKLKSNGIIEYFENTVGKMPIRRIDFDSQADRTSHDRMIELVGRMEALHVDLVRAATDHQKTSLQYQMDATDRQIERLVYQLYDIGEDQMQIVEDALHG